MDKEIKVIVVDDHDFFRQGVCMTLSKLENIRLLGEAANGKEFLDLLKTQTPDVVLMDIKMPEMDGIETTYKALDIKPKLKILALTMFGDKEYLHQMLDAGAVGFLLKNISRVELLEALETVMDGKQYYSKEMLAFFATKYLKKQGSPEPIFSEKEIEVLHCIAEGMNNQEIAKNLNVTVRTVTNHRASLLKKTGSKNTLSLLSYAVKHNLADL